MVPPLFTDLFLRNWNQFSQHALALPGMINVALSFAKLITICLGPKKKCENFLCGFLCDSWCNDLKIKIIIALSRMIKMFLFLERIVSKPDVENGYKRFWRMVFIFLAPADSLSCWFVGINYFYGCSLLLSFSWCFKISASPTYPPVQCLHDTTKPFGRPYFANLGNFKVEQKEASHIGIQFISGLFHPWKK